MELNEILDFVDVEDNNNFLTIQPLTVNLNSGALSNFIKSVPNQNEVYS